ncbi:hypothetical protein TNCV_5013901 [Trichonephila clavipes]|nr:hypothetical protein TNCV_5013901 [Trichonephila clavipes]
MAKEASRIPFSRLLGRKPEFWGCQGKTEFGVVETRVNQTRDGPVSRKKESKKLARTDSCFFPNLKMVPTLEARWLFWHRVKNRTRHLANFA